MASFPRVLFLLLGCDGDEKLLPGGDSGGTNSEPTDADGDGNPTTTDCDDLDAAIHPDAIETCNEVDDNCDGSREEGVTSTFYADQDSDSYGDPDNQLAACEMPTGYRTDSSDCDDTNPAAYPGAQESCTDPTDLNCDGSTSFVDADGDTVAACVDCNDQEPSVWPGAPETDGDGIDQNCDGVICQEGPPGAISIWRGEGDLMDEVGGRHGSATRAVS